MSILLFRIVAALCFLAVALGAFGAHALRSTIESHGLLEVWNKAVLDNLIMPWRCSRFRASPRSTPKACFLLLAGIILFSGSLYVMALTNLRRFGAITPLDGLCFLAGWAWLVVAPPR